MMAVLTRNSITTASRLRNLLIGFTLIVLAGCAGQPFEPDTVGEIPSGPGVLSGEDGEFTIYDSEGGLFGKKRIRRIPKLPRKMLRPGNSRSFSNGKKKPRNSENFRNGKKPHGTQMNTGSFWNGGNGRNIKSGKKASRAQNEHWF